MPDSREKHALRFRCLIVDDERLAREGIAALLSDDPRFVIVGEANGGRDALRLLANIDVDVVFLDVQMPGVDGFEVLETLDEQRRDHLEVVFVTAFNDYAIRAFDAAALDYVLKPVDEDRFHVMLDRIARRLSERTVIRTADELIAALHAATAMNGIATRGVGHEAATQKASSDATASPGYLSRFAVRSAGRTLFVDAKDVDLIEADGYCVKLHALGRTHVLRATMATIEARLDPAHFIRVHRSAIVNVGHVAELRPYDRGHYTLLLRSGQTVRMSRKRRQQLGALFG